MVIPNEITAGLSVKIQAQFKEYPASEWSATLYLRSATSQIDIEATADGDDFVFSATAATTADWSEGLYSAIIRVTSGNETYQPVSERLTVLPDITASTYDPRTDSEKALEAIQAVLLSRATSDQLKLSFNGRSLEKTPLSDLIALESRYINKVNAERRKKAGKGPFKINRVRLG